MSNLRRRLPLELRSYHFWPWHYFVNVVLASPLVPRRWLAPLLRFAGFDVRGKVIVRPGAFFTTSNVTMADETFIQNGARLVSQGGITFGRRSGISYGTILLTQTHEVRGPRQRWSPEVHTAPIVIGEGVWIGAGVVVGPGVTIGDGCIVAAGSVVMRDCEPHGIYQGNPARRVKDLPMEDPGPGSLADLGYTPVMPPRESVG